MAFRRLLPRLALLMCSLLLACARPRPGGEGFLLQLGDALRARFPAQAARVLDASGGFMAAAAGFSAEPRYGVAAELPLRAEGALRFALDPAFAVQVREVGALGEGAREGRAVRYPRALGASFWAADEDGYEEWLLLEADAVRRDAPIAAWEIEGATARQRGDAIALVDARGEARLVVTAPEAYAAGGRPVAARLSARGARIELWVDAEGEAVLVDPAWRRTRSLTQGRAGHAATRLADGRVLVVGGSDGVSGLGAGTGPCTPARDPVTSATLGCALASAEVYDPGALLWASAGSMTRPRLGHTATTLLDHDGTVLVVGGIAYDGDPVAGTAAFAATERYDPATGLWTAAAPMLHARAYHTATRLADGRILVAGGMASGYAVGIAPVPVPSAEVYDPAQNTWTDAGALVLPRAAGHTATLLADGTVLVTGGIVADGDTTRAAEVFDPQVDPSVGSPWKGTAGMITFRSGHTATLLQSGTVLVTGSNVGVGAATAERYTPTPGKVGYGTWSLTGAMNAARYGHTATLIANGQVIVAGGAADNDDSAEAYDPPSAVFLALPATNVYRQGHTATLLDDDDDLDPRILVAGGIGVPDLSSAEVYDTRAHEWTPVAPMFDRRLHHTATLLASGRVLVAGGTSEQSTDQSTATIYRSAEVYDPDTHLWSVTQAMVLDRAGHTATLLHSGQVLVAGGASGYSAFTTKVELYDPDSEAWTATAPLNVARESHMATLLTDGRVLVTGGFNGGGLLASAEIYDPVAATWEGTGSMSNGRYAHAATLLANGQVLVTGGHIAVGHGEGACAFAELYDPAIGAWSPASSMGTARAYHTSTLLPDGRVLVTGGNGLDVTAVASAEAYDPIGDGWTAIASMNGGHLRHTAIGLRGGIVLVAGGDSTSAETYDPSAATEGGPTWTLVASMQTLHDYAALAPLGADGVLVTGGRPSSADPGGAPGLDTAEVFQPQAAGAVCAAAFECAQGPCLGGVCCNDACNVGCGACSVADGAPNDGRCTMVVACGAGFACKDESTPLACFTACTTSKECAPGFVCDASHDCVTPHDTYVDTCALSRLGPASPVHRPPFEPVALLLAGLATRRRRAPSKAVRVLARPTGRS